MTFSAVKEILNEKVIVAINQDKGSVPLKEDDPQSKLKKVEIYGLHEDTIVFKLDYKKIKKKSDYLSNKEGLHSGCDYVIVTRYKEKNFILFSELKSSIKSRSIRESAGEQLRHSTPFIEYIVSLLKIHYGLNFEFKYHYIVFGLKRLNKKRTYTGKRIIDYSPVKFKDLTIKFFKNTEEVYISEILRDIN